MFTELSGEKTEIDVRLFSRCNPLRVIWSVEKKRHISLFSWYQWVDANANFHCGTSISSLLCLSTDLVLSFPHSKQPVTKDVWPALEKLQSYKPPQLSINMSMHSRLHGMVNFMLQFATSRSVRRIMKVHCSSILKHPAPLCQAGNVGDVYGSLLPLLCGPWWDMHALSRNFIILVPRFGSIVQSSDKTLIYSNKRSIQYKGCNNQII